MYLTRPSSEEYSSFWHTMGPWLLPSETKCEYLLRIQRAKAKMHVEFNQLDYVSALLHHRLGSKV